jgi:hypothetical protein
MLKLKLHSRSPLAALTAGLVVGTVLSSLSLAAGAADFEFTDPTPQPSTRPQPNKGHEAPFGTLGTIGESKGGSMPEDEIDPDDLAAELGLPTDDDSPFENKHGLSKNIPQSRVVSPKNFGDYRVNLDIFRKSKSRPVLGEFREEYTAVLVPNSEGMSDEARTREAKKTFRESREP